MSEMDELSQSNYQETPYADESWEIVGERIDNTQFVPMDIPVVAKADFSIDPMFEDFGGGPSEHSTERWHLPEGESVESYVPSTDNQVPAEQLEELARQHAEELERVKAETREAALQEATAAAQEESKALMAQMHESIRAVFDDLESQLSERAVEMERGAVELALAISKKLIDGAVEINPEYLVPIVQEALSQSGTAVVRKIRVSPQDMEFIDVVGVRNLVKEYDGNWDFEADETVHAGCVVETSAGEIDYQIDKAWERIQDQVMKVAR